MWLHTWIGVLVWCFVYAIVGLQRGIAVVVVTDLLGMHDQLIDKGLLGVDMRRHQTRQNLPEHRQQQDPCTSLKFHT